MYKNEFPHKKEKVSLSFYSSSEAHQYFRGRLIKFELTMHIKGLKYYKSRK